MPHMRHEAEILSTMLSTAIEGAMRDIAAIPPNMHPLLRNYEVETATREASGIAETIIDRRFRCHVGREATYFARRWLDGDLMPVEAVGIAATGKKDSACEDASKQLVKFQNSLADEMDAFKRQNNNRAPNQAEVQSMVNKLLMPIVIKTPGMLWGTNETQARAFQATGRPDDSTVEVAVDYADIPVDLRRGIAVDIERELGRRPSQNEVVKRYEDFVLSR